jgi:hypothetical protein
MSTGRIKAAAVKVPDQDAAKLAKIKVKSEVKRTAQKPEIRKNERRRVAERRPQRRNTRQRNVHRDDRRVVRYRVIDPR